MPRRIISGLDDQDKSAVLIDDELRFNDKGGILAWSTASAPADNTAMPAPGLAPDFALMETAASTFIVVRMPPGAEAPMHVTATIDYITMISGQMTFGVETGEVTLSAGDVLVDRGVIHSWRNDGSEDAVYTVVSLPAVPLKAGAGYDGHD